MLNLHHLRVFLAVTEQSGFSRAAAKLRLSQPAVSKSVRELERQVGLALIDRSERGATLTDAGRALAARATELFAVEQAAEAELRSLRGVARGRLDIGASTTIATYMLPAVLSEFHTRHPSVALHVTSANTRAVASMLLRRKIDVALVEGPVESARIEVRHWRDDRLVVIAPRDHPLTSKRSVSSGALQHLPFIVRERGSGTREIAARALASRGITVKRVLVLASTEAIKQAVAAGLGLAIVSAAAAADQIALETIGVVRTSDLPLQRSLAQLTVRGRPESASAAAFRTLLYA